MSSHGLLTTVAYKLGKDVPPIYALEGSVAIAGIFEIISHHVFIIDNIFGKVLP